MITQCNNIHVIWNTTTWSVLEFSQPHRLPNGQCLYSVQYFKIDLFYIYELRKQEYTKAVVKFDISHIFSLIIKFNATVWNFVYFYVLIPSPFPKFIEFRQWLNWLQRTQFNQNSMAKGMISLAYVYHLPSSTYIRTKN